MEDSSATDAKLEQREMEDVWSDFPTLRRLYSLLQQNTSVADRGGGHENGETLDEKSVFLLKKMLDDATQQEAIQSQTKILINTAEKPPEPLENIPSHEINTPNEPQISEEHQICHHRPTQAESALLTDSDPLTQQKTRSETRVDKLEKNNTEFEFGRSHLKEQNSIKILDEKNMLKTKIPSVRDLQRHRERQSQGHRTVNEHSSRKVKREISHKLVDKPMASNKMTRQRSVPSASHAKNRMVVSHKRSRVEPRRVTNDVPKLDRSGTESTLGQICVKNQAMRGQMVQRGQQIDRTKLKKKQPLDFNTTAQIEFHVENKNANQHNHKADQIGPSIRRPPIKPKQRTTNHSSSTNLEKNRAVSRNPSQLRRNPRLRTTDASRREKSPPKWTLSSSSSSSTRSLTRSSSSSIISTSNRNRRIPDRTVVIRPRSRRTSPVLTRHHSFGSKRVPTRSTSLQRPPKHNQLEHVRSDTHRTPQEEDVKNNTKKKDGSLRRIKDKLSIVFHHHHHHYNHDHEHEHKSLWKYLRGKLHHHHKKKKKELEVIGERAAERVPGHDQHGYFHALVDGLVRHLWHAKAKRSGVGRMQVKKKHWWQRKWRKRGGVKLGSRRKKARLRIGFGRKHQRSMKKTKS